LFEGCFFGHYLLKKDAPKYGKITKMGRGKRDLKIILLDNSWTNPRNKKEPTFMIDVNP